MNISFSAEHEAFRDEVRRFLDDNLTDDLREAQRFCPGIFLDYEHNIVWHRILHRQGWIAPSWPKEYGGTGWDLTRRYIWTRESTLAGAPSLAPMGIGMCGPMLIGYGTQAQKDYYLPRILSGEDYWCQGYSEPGSGSDLASLKLRADVDGDHYVLNGSKIWTTHAHYANRMFCLVRTSDQGKPQSGITFLLLDMDTPGISVEPIVFASGDHEVNQVFFDDVRVPRENRVGEENQGWTVAKYLLEFERGGGGSAAQEAAMARLRRLAAAVPVGDGTLAEDPDFRRRLDEADVQLQAVQYTEFRTLAALSHGKNPGPESSIMKNLSADITQRLTELAVEAVAEYAQVYQPEARTVGSGVSAVGPDEGIMALPRYFNLRSSSIAGGTNEVQKNIVAKLVLGL
ncbi:MAG: acyl-CoA dehydrogenase [Gammaproteobacteria bacterium]|nr:acyl-CoA dehydrogenase [Gammaproteobacteria bacterium]MBK80433.1 acyl-CoA dehydrogenase [Gammaproteobacteria bacterium]|tara:strand:+ start:277 stop:1476 length:1200 start_codon:yes stop_codon:yes gene_type:complete